MPVAVILIVLASALLHALWNGIIKGGQDKFTETALNTSGGALLGVLALPWLPALPASAWGYLASSVVVHLFYYFFLSQAYRYCDLTYAYPLMRGTAPLLTGLVSVWVLAQPLSLYGWLSLGLICLGILVMGGNAIYKRNFSLPGTLAALGNALVIMLYTVLDGQGVHACGLPLIYGCWLFILNGACLLLLNLVLRRRAFCSYVNPKRLLFGLGGGMASLIAYAMVLWGMTQAAVPLVAGLRESSVIFGMMGAILFLGEKLNLFRLAAILLLAAGAAGLHFA